MKNLNSLKLFIILIFSFILLNSFKKDYFEVSKQIDIFTSLFKELNIYYVDDTAPDKLMKEAINSMLKTLDPYTVFMTEEESETFKSQTTGEYAGIGVTIEKIDNKVVIVNTFKGFSADKAGLKVGDEIIEIDNRIITSSNYDSIVSFLKGNIGSTLHIKAKRPYTNKTINVEIYREKISMKAVPYAGMLDNEIGYISLSLFSRKATKEVMQSYYMLKDKGMKSLVFDLRGNPGGILSQAVSISNIFIPEGTTIVETKARIANWNRSYSTKHQAKDTKIPIVILTNYRSASASEIVAGAFQDLDRAVIIGERTFGKGLVQQPRSLNYGTQIKITVAKYYTPSGRCIQAKDYFHKNKDGTVNILADSLRNKFTTKSGRIVFDGAGIEPDIIIKSEHLSKISKELIVNNHIFDYSIKYCNKTKGKINLDNYKFTDKDFHEFENFLVDKGFEYKSELQIKLDEINKLAIKEKIHLEIKDEIEVIKVASNKNEYLKKNKDQISNLLTLNIINNDFNEVEQYKYITKNDALIDSAIAILQNKKQYNSILNK